MAAREVFKTLTLLALIMCGPAFAAAPRANFDIPAGIATKTLQSYYEQTRIEILYLADTPRGLPTNAVSGDLDVETALSRLLKGLPLEFTFDPSYRFVSVRPAHQVTGNASPDTGVAEVLVQDLQLPGAPQEVAGTAEPQPTVFVTGTYIPGVLDIASPLVSVQRRQVLSSTYATVQDVLQEMPIASKAGPSEDHIGSGNFNRGVGINLRGLGVEATLILVNGRRQPSSGVFGDFVDVSNIPASAVERIEVLPDGVSAVYGSDAIAGVVNVILRSDVEGLETFLRRGSAEGGADETLLSQIMGTHWESGHGTLAYQFLRRTALSASERRYSESSDKTSLSGSDFRSNLSSPANILDPKTLAPLSGVVTRADGRAITSADLSSSLINLQDRAPTLDLLPNRKQHNLLINGEQEFGEYTTLTGELRMSRRDTSAHYYAVDQLLLVSPANPYLKNLAPNSPMVVGYSFLDDFGVVEGIGRTDSVETSLGLTRELGAEWSASLNGWLSVERMKYDATNQAYLPALAAALNSTDADTAFNPFGRNSATVLNTIRTVQQEAARSRISVAQFLANGPILAAPGGDVRVSLGLERRADVFDRGGQSPRQFSREVRSVFTEAAIPLIGDPKNPRGTPRLELSLATRHERYSDFGQTTNPKVGLRFAPAQWLKLRTSWGTSFRAPKLPDIYDDSRNSAAVVLLADPTSPTGRSLVLARQGRGEQLHQETADTWTAGLDLAFHELLDAKFSATYFSTRYRQRIAVPAAASMVDILRREDQWRSAVDRTPSQEEINAVCDAPGLVGSITQCKSSPVVALVDYRTRNLAATRAEGLDLRLESNTASRLGHFHSDLQTTYYFQLQQAASPDSDYVSILDTVGNPTRFRAHASLQWSERGPTQPGFSLELGIDHTGRYRDVEANRSVTKLTLLDVRASYHVPDRLSSMSGMELGLNVANILNTSPPFIDREWGYDSLNADPYGRVWSVTAEKRW